MSLADRLQGLAATAAARARAAGLPGNDTRRLYENRLRPLLVRRMSPRIIAFVRRTGVRVAELEPGRVVCEMPLAGNANHIGTMYAGALFTLAEFPGGVLMLATFGLTRFIPIVTELDMAFVKAAKSDVRIELRLGAAEAARIEAETLADGKSILTLTGELTDGHGALVAHSRAEYQMRARRR